MSNAKKIQTWRDDNPDEQITEPVLLGILGVDSLQNASYNTRTCRAPIYRV